MQQDLENEDGEENEDEETDPEEYEEEEDAVEEVVTVDPRNFLTRQQVSHFKNMFDTISEGKKDKIKTKMIGFVLRMIGLNPTKAEIKQHIKEVDPNNTGVMDFQAFLLPIARSINKVPETHEEVIAAFRIFDEGDEETVGTEQLIDSLTTLGEDLEDFEIEILLKLADSKGTGRIKYVEFVHKMMGVNRKSKKGQKGKKKVNQK